MENMKVWLLKTKNGTDVFLDSTGAYTLDRTHSPVEYFEGQLFESKEDLAKKVSEFLHVECVWKPGSNLNLDTNDHLLS